MALPGIHGTRAERAETVFLAETSSAENPAQESGITRLRAECCEVPEGFLASLAGRIEELSLYHTAVEGDGLAELASPGGPGALRRLELELSGLGGLARLADSPRFANLTGLSVHGHGIGPEGVEALAASAHLTRLASLRLSGCHVRADGAEALAGSANLKGLVALHLPDNEIDRRGVAALAA